MGEPDRLSDQELRKTLESLVRHESLVLLDLARMVVPVAGFIGVAAPLAASSIRGEAAFFRTAATVIPTLLLTLAVQGRFFRLNAISRSALLDELHKIKARDLSALGVPRWSAWLALYAARRLAAPLGMALRYALILFY